MFQGMEPRLWEKASAHASCARCNTGHVGNTSVARTFAGASQQPTSSKELALLEQVTTANP